MHVECELGDIFLITRVRFFEVNEDIAMSDLQANSTFSEKLRRIRFRRTREKTRFRDELRIIPKWLIVTVIVLFIATQAGFLIANVVFHALSDPPGGIFPYPTHP